MAVVPFNRVQLFADLKLEERFVSFVYDDANGKRVVPGYRMVGHPTVGYGLALDVDGLTENEAAMLLATRADRHISSIQKMFPWVVELSDARQRGLYDMSFNLGDHGLATFGTFLQLMRLGSYNLAADDLQQSKWSEEVGDRAKRIVGQIRSG